MAATWDVTNVVEIYQDNIDRLIDQLGKTVRVYFDPLKTGMDSDNYSPVHNDKKLPAYKENSVTETRTYVDVTALIKWNPRDVNKYKINFKEGKAIVRLKTMLSDVPNLLRADYIVPNFDSIGVIEKRFKIIAGPIPVGLQEDRYAVSFWEEV